MLFLAGLFLGCLVGFTIACLCNAAKDEGGAMPVIKVEFLEKAALQR